MKTPTLLELQTRYREMTQEEFDEIDPKDITKVRFTVYTEEMSRRKSIANNILIHDGILNDDEQQSVGFGTKIIFLFMVVCLLTVSTLVYMQSNNKILMLSPALIIKDLSYYIWPTNERTPIAIQFVNGDSQVEKEASRTPEDIGMDRAYLNRIAFNKYKYDKALNEFNAALNLTDANAIESTGIKLYNIQSLLAKEIEFDPDFSALVNGDPVFPIRVFLHISNIYARFFAISLVLLVISCGLLFLSPFLRSSKSKQKNLHQ